MERRQDSLEREMRREKDKEKERKRKKHLNNHRSEPGCLKRQTSDTSISEYCAR